MTTTEDLRRELRSAAGTPGGLDPLVILEAAHVRRRVRRRATAGAAALGAAALAVPLATGLVDRDEGGDVAARDGAGPTYASVPWTVEDDGSIVFDSQNGPGGAVVASTDDSGFPCVAVRGPDAASACLPPDRATADVGWANALLFFGTTAPVTDATVTADGATLTATVFSLPEDPELRLVAVVLESGRGFTTDVVVDVTGVDASGTPVLERRIEGRAASMPRNASGQSYGDALEYAGSRVIPDLVAITTDDGLAGYVLATDLAQGVHVATTTDLLRFLDVTGARRTTVVPVVAVDGVTPLGVATVRQP